MKRAMLAFAAVGAFAGLAFGEGESPSVTTNTMTSFGSSSIATADYWNLGYGNETYVYWDESLGGRLWYQSVGTTTTPPGKAWVFGSAGGKAINLYCRQGNLFFKNDGVFLASGYVQSWPDGAGDEGKRTDVYYRRGIGGTVTVLSPDAAPFNFGFEGTCKDVYYDFSAKMKGGAGTALEFTNGLEPTGFARGNGVRFSGDMSEFAGTVKVGTKYFVELGSTDPSVGAITFPGTLSVAGGARLIARAQGLGFSVGSLDLAAGFDGIEFAFSVSDGEVVGSSAISVGQLTMADAKLKIRLTGSIFGGIDPDNPDEYVLLRLPTDSGITEQSLDVDLSALNMTGNEHTVKVTEAGGEIVVSLARNSAKVISAKAGSSGSGAPSAFNDATGYQQIWDDPEGDHVRADCDYYVKSKTLRTVYGATRDDCLAHAYVAYAGELVFQAKNTRFTDFYMHCSTEWYNWHNNGDKTVNTFAVGGTKTISGRIHLMGMADHNVFRLTQTPNGSYFNISSDIDGDASQQIKLTNNSASSALESWVELSGDNSGYLGSIAVYGADESGVATTLAFRKAENLGGSPETFAAAALNLYNHATLWARESVTLDTANRGIRFSGCGGNVKVEPGTTLTVRQTIDFGADVNKTGAGTLALGGGLTLTGSPTLFVREGALKAVGKEAFDGLTVSMAAGTELLLDTPDQMPDDVKDCGLYNVQAAMPFVLADGKLHVTLDRRQPYDAYPTSFVLPVCTLSAAAAANLSADDVDVKARGYTVKVTKKANADGSVTYLADCARSGFCILLR